MVETHFSRNVPADASAINVNELPIVLPERDLQMPDVEGGRGEGEHYVPKLGTYEDVWVLCAVNAHI
jgi:hypothetical protein